MKLVKVILLLPLMGLSLGLSLKDVQRELNHFKDSVSVTWEDIKDDLENIGDAIGQTFNSVGEAITWLRDEISGIRIHTPKLDQDFWDSVTPNISVESISKISIPSLPEILDDLDNGIEIGGTLGQLGNKAKKELSMDKLINEWLPHWDSEARKIWKRWFQFPSTCASRGLKGKDFWDCKREGVEESSKKLEQQIHVSIKSIKDRLRQRNQDINDKLGAI